MDTITKKVNSVTSKSFLHQPLHLAFGVIFIFYLLYTGLTTPDLKNWALENTLTLSLVTFLVAFYNIFRFSDLSYTLIFLFLLLHMYGSQYQYADNPFGEWLREQYNLDRNHYDRLVHLGFGLLLAYPIHEVLILGFKVNRFYSYLMPMEIILSLSALYELIEWIVADLIYEEQQQGMDFLGMQSDIWDAQKDMGLALAGAFIAILTAIILKELWPAGKR
jgi:putative membrane protein